MSKRKYPSELNTRTIRVNIGDWLALKELSQRAGVTIAEAFHLAVSVVPHGEVIRRIPAAQVPMLAVNISPFQVTSRLMPGRVTGNGVAHLQPRIIREVR